MNTEQDQPEPLSAIIAEMRDERIIRLDDAVVTRCLLRNLADRIEAAAKRELSRAADVAASKATLDRTAKDAVEYMAYAMARNPSPQSGKEGGDHA